MSMSIHAATIVLTVSLLFAPMLVAQENGTTPRRPDGTPIYSSQRVQLNKKDWARPGITKEVLEKATVYYTLDGGQSWIPSSAGMQEANAQVPYPHCVFKAAQDGQHGFYFRLSGDPAPGVGTMPDKQQVYIDTTAPGLRIIAPDGTTTAKNGQPVTIVYEYDDPNPAQGKGIKIEYSLNEGQNWSPITTDSAPTGNYVWTPTVTDTVKCWIRITASDVVGNTTMPVRSQVPFTIEGPPKNESGPIVEELDEQEIKVFFVGPKHGRIFFEYTDFYYKVTNSTKSATKLVRVWYSMDGGMTWQVGGANRTGENEGKVTVYFHEGFRRNGSFGNYQKIDFYYQVVTVDNIKNVPDPAETAMHFSMDSYSVDIEGPSLAVYTPAFGDVLYRGQIPNNTESGKYFIEWDGADRNLIPHVTMAGYERGPVAIYYSSNPDAREPLWTLLADRLPIDGRFIKFNDLPLGRCQIKLVGMDQMGNTSTRMTGIFDVRDGSGYSNPVQPVNDIEIDRLWSEALNLYQHKKYAESVDKYDRALAIAVDVSSERSDPLRHDKAVALYAKGQVEDARALLEGVVARNPDGLKYRYTLASVYLRSGSRAKAQSQCEEITKRDEVEPHVAARAMLASIHYQDGQTAKAEELWKSVVKHGSPASAEYKEAKMQLEAMEQRKKK